MTTLKGSICTCPQCSAECLQGRDLIHVQQYRTLWGEVVRWTRCKACGKTSRQVYDYEAHRFGLPTTPLEAYK